MSTPTPPFRVITTRDLDDIGLFEGSSITVERVDETHYHGVHSSRGGTYPVSVLQKDCRIEHTPRTLTEVCGITEAAFQEHLRRPAPDDGRFETFAECAGNPVPPHERPGAKQRRVVCAANRNPQGDLVIGPRHHDPVMREQIKTDIALRTMVCDTVEDVVKAMWRGSEQGFIDQWGTFMTREEAWEVATAAGQVLYGPHLGGGRLDSLDLY